MQEINISDLQPHPRNSEFFDDITGDAWNVFVESIKTSGIIEPIIATQDLVIVSGHQRVRAAKQLGMQKVMVDIRRYDDEDKILKDLIETNIRQRGVGNPNPIKFGKCIEELERIEGIQHGGDHKSESKKSNPKVSDLITQKDLANELGISVDTLENYKKLSNLIPEIGDLVETGKVSTSTALAIVKELSPEEQEEFVRSMDVTKKITKAEAQKYINDVKYPPDYEQTKRELSYANEEISRLTNESQKAKQELRDIRKAMETEKENTPREKYSKKLQDSVLLFCAEIDSFLERFGGYVWLTDEVDQIPELEREGYIKAVNAVKSWADTMDYNLNNRLKEIR